MGSFLEKECNLKYFHENGYIRKKCESCGDYYWTLDERSTTCGDQPCVKFSFINKPLGKKSLSLTEVRKSFLTFFEENNHSRLLYPITGQRFPVVARWRSDIYLTIASIADFQPHVTSGEVPPPANPLVISQPCIRLNDLEEVGVSGRHLTTFEMMGHHAFNKNTDEIYFKEKTVSLCDKYFTKMIGLPREKIKYKEQLWFGGGNAGPCLEVLAGGLEIATLVFMNMREDKKGKFEINGKKYSQNPLNIVDTGYGLERIAWITHGTKNIYETVFPKIINWIKDHAEKSIDTPSLYSLTDHTKCLAFMLGDGIVPSNIKEGYLARLIIRRCLRFMDKIKLKGNLKNLVLMQLDLLGKDFPSLVKEKKQIGEILDIETKKFKDTISKGKQLVKRILQDKGTINQDELISLYDTHGMPPEIVKNIAKKEGVTVDIPDDFESRIAEIHTHQEKRENSEEIKQELPQTEPLYYKDQYQKEFDATILWKHDTEKETEIILDKTVFYPEGGGQPCDTGYLFTRENKIPVKSVVKKGNAIIHIVDKEVNVGDKVHGVIDWEHRYTLMKHHTGTHLVNGALRTILGDHIWQAGSQLGINEARFDFSHYKSISEKEVKKIENLCNEYIKKSIPVHKKVMDRNTAEKTYGFRLYQGGVPPGDNIHILDIPNVDVEACGGTHLDNTSEIENIKIIKAERIQDGVNRVIFAASKMAEAYQEEEIKTYKRLINVLKPFYEIKRHEKKSEQLKNIASLFSVPKNQLEKTIKRFLRETTTIKRKTSVKTLVKACEHLFNQWKKTQKEKKQISTDEVKGLKKKAEIVSGEKIKIITGITSSDGVSLAGKLIQEDNYIVHIFDGEKLISMASENIEIDLRRIAPEIGKIMGGSGGGKPHMTQSGGPKLNNVNQALKKAVALTIELIKNKS